MLVFISDLHFIDGSAGEKHNIPPQAFRVFMEAICSLTKTRDISDLAFVFLGDIFDLLRTEMWFGCSATDTPWGNNETGIEANANAIFDAIIKKNKETFDLLGGNLKQKFPDLPCEPKRIYVPGNHDRLCNKYTSLRKKVCKALGIDGCNPDIPFEHSFQDIDHAVFARHGHEFDEFNYEGGLAYSHDDYMRVPIGDPITTELVARLPWTVMQTPEVAALPPDEQETLKRNLQDIENVRPFSGTIEWLLYQVKKNPRVKDVIENSIDKVIQRFNTLAFVENWYKHHDKWTDFMDEADKIQSALFVLEKFKVFSLERLMPLIETLKKRFMDDSLLEAAPMEYSRLDNRLRYIVYGHTHDPLQVPIRTVAESVPLIDHVYLNTGTWRVRPYKTKEGPGFVRWKNLTYTIFYKKGERKRRGEKNRKGERDKNMDFPTYETWTGTLQ